MPAAMNYRGHVYGGLEVLSDYAFSEEGRSMPVVLTRCLTCGLERTHVIGPLRYNSRMHPNRRHCRECSYPKHPLRKWWSTSKWQLSDEWQSFEQMVADIGDAPEDGMHPVHVDTRIPIGPDNWQWGTRIQRGALRHVLEGKPLKYWGEQFGVTRQRVQQLVARYGTIAAVRERMGKQVQDESQGSQKAAFDLLESIADGEVHVLKSLPCSVGVFQRVAALYKQLRGVDYKSALFDGGETVVIQVGDRKRGA